MTYATNPRAHFDYEILETIEVGLVLFGFEVKAIRQNKLSIKGSYIKILGSEAWLVGALISPYQPGNIPPDYDQQRNRKLLLNKKELAYITLKAEEAGLTIVPIKVYARNGVIKLEIGIARGKKKSDKRAVITKRETQRAIERTLKTQNNP